MGSNSRPQSADSSFLASSALRAFAPFPGHPQVDEDGGVLPRGSPSAQSIFVTGGGSLSSRVSGSGSLARCQDVNPGAYRQLSSVSQDAQSSFSHSPRSALQSLQPTDGARRGIQNGDSPLKRGMMPGAAICPRNSQAPASPLFGHRTGAAAPRAADCTCPRSPTKASREGCISALEGVNADHGMISSFAAGKGEELKMSHHSLLEEEVCSRAQCPTAFPRDPRTDPFRASFDVSLKSAERMQATMGDRGPGATTAWQNKMQAHLCVHFCRQGLLARVLYMSERPSPHPLFSWRRPPGMYSTGGW